MFQAQLGSAEPGDILCWGKEAEYAFCVLVRRADGPWQQTLMQELKELPTMQIWLMSGQSCPEK